MSLRSSCSSWLIGISVAVIANISSSLGMNFQKRAHTTRNEKKRQSESQKVDDDIEATESLIQLTSSTHPHPSPNTNKRLYEGHKLSSLDTAPSNGNNNKSINTINSRHVKTQSASYVCEGQWLLGLFALVMGGIGDFVALGYAPESVVAPLGSLTLVVNAFLSPCMHDEKPSFRTLLCTTIIIIGAAVTVASSPRNDNIESIEAAFGIYGSKPFLLYALCVCTFIVCGWFFCQYLKHASIMKQAVYERRYFKYHRFAIAAISGTMGAQNLLFAKSISTLIVKAHQNENESVIKLFTYFETYLILFGLLFTIFFQLRWLNEGLRRFSALYVAPTFQAFWITVSVLGGLVVFEEFDTMIRVQKFVFSFGVLITVIGVFCLSQQDKPQTLHGSITIRHYIPLAFCFLVLYFVGSTFLHSKYSLCS